MILAVLQARMSSTRLPGKVLRPILGTPMIFLQIERVMRCRRIDRLVVATSRDPSDDALADECATRKIAIYRGCLTDVLKRFANVVKEYRPKAVVRLTADCPLADWNVIDLAVQTYLDGNYQYVSNAVPQLFPQGLDAEVVDPAVLLTADDEANLPSEREHVTVFVRNHPGRFRSADVPAPKPFPALRWTVDEPEDFELVRRVYEALYPSNPAFLTEDILALLEAHPELNHINEKFLLRS